MGRLLLAAAAAAIVSGCDSDDNLFPDVQVLQGPEAEVVAGFWTGVGEITGADDVNFGFAAAGTERPFQFPVALRLTFDRRFTLWAGHLQTLYDSHTCAGVYEIEHGSIFFFPDQTCRALPLLRYTIGTSHNLLFLEARTNRTFSEPGTRTASIRVFFRVERD